MSSDLIPRARMDEILARRRAALDKYAEGFRMMCEARVEHGAAAYSLLGGISPLPERLRFEIQQGGASDFTESVRRIVDRDVWRSIVESSSMWSLMDREEHAKFEAALKDCPLEVTAANVEATLARLYAESASIFRRGLVNAFARRCRDYKSNDAFKIGPRVVITHGCEWWDGGSWYLPLGAAEELRDYDRYMHVLDGKAAPDGQQGLVGAVRSAMAARQNRVVTPYWDARWHKNGNMHLRCEREDLLDAANRQIAEHYGLALGNDRARQSAADKPVAHADDFGDFPSPPAVVARLLELAELEPGMTVLEPSAGAGNIAFAAYALGGLVTCVEIQEKRARVLRTALTSVICGDFMQLDERGTGKMGLGPSRFDRVLMNPPFAPSCADARHVLRAWRFVKPGGRLVAVVSGVLAAHTLPGPWIPNGVELEFRDWYRTYGAYAEPLPPGAFKASGTNVRATIIVADKPLTAA